MDVHTSLLMVAILLLSIHRTVAQIGVCYGTKGDNLPCPQDVVNLYKSNGIRKMRIYEPNLDTLKALQGTNIKLVLGVLNDDIPILADNQSNADKWVQTNVIPFASSIKYIAVGNEIKPYEKQAPSVEPAMKNILYSLKCNNLETQIKVSTAVDSSLITNSYPPSDAQFINLTYITPIINFLVNNNSPLFVNINPYVAYINNPNNISLDYALFTACRTVFTDKNNGKQYQNLFDALYDAMYVAVQKVVAKLSSIDNGSTNKKFIPNNQVGEAGWSSKKGFHHPKIMNKNYDFKQKCKLLGCGGPISMDDGGANVINARTFYTNLIEHVKKGTPLTQGQELETYLFAMFDEDKKPGNESERHYGLFTPDGKPKYGQLNFS